MTIIGALLGFLLLPGGSQALAAPAVPAPAPVPNYLVTLTAYNAVAAQTDSDPLVTASGAFSNPEIVAARSNNLADEMPFGTVIEIDGSANTSANTCGYGVVANRIGYRVIADSMNARYTDRVDVLFDTKASYPTADRGMRNAADILGICKGVTVRVVGHVDIHHLPKTQVELAAVVNRNGSKLALN